MGWAAIPSTAPTATASLAGDDFASRTVPAAHSTLRPRVSAMELLTGIESIDGLRNLRGLSARATQAVLRDALGALLRSTSTTHENDTTTEERHG